MTLGIELITYLDDDPIFPFECIDCTYKLDPNLSDDFLELYKFQDDGDVMICVQDIKFPVYKKVLKARCSKLYEMVDHHQQMSDGNDNQVALTDIKPEIFKRVLEYIYTGKVEDLDDHAENLLEAASNYKLTGLKNLCEDSIINYYYTEENSEQVKSLAVNCGAINLMRNVLGIKATTGGIAVYENFYRSGILERMEMLAN
ncbi:speckle-type POZ protein-like [Microplitis mediator]|uniref:speckle-type POZ protein-like n=1 Tax=Microplitis mediator TaxID=375433 RepID=UPI002552AC8B|nr:speckle-type POZ protein-like [Microplitis mediator]